MSACTRRMLGLPLAVLVMLALIACTEAEGEGELADTGAASEVAKGLVISLTEEGPSGESTMLMRDEYLFDEQTKEFLELPDHHEQNLKFLSFQSDAMLSARLGAGADAVKTGLDITKFAWDVVKDNRPETVVSGAFSSILSKAEDDYLSYPNAKSFQSGVYRFEVKELVPKLQCLKRIKKTCVWSKPVLEPGPTSVNFRFRIAGYYNADAPPGSAVPNGKYLPQVFFKFEQADAWLGYKVNASAEIRGAANEGAADNVNPAATVVANLSVGSPIQHWSKSYYFKVTGQQGFVKAW